MGCLPAWWGLGSTLRQEWPSGDSAGMFSSFFLTLDWTARLMRRVSMSRKRLVAAVSLLLVGGGLEGATVGLLVPLLSMLTGTNSPTRGYVQMVIDTVFGSF